MSWGEHCSRCGDGLDEDRHGETLCRDCDDLLERRARAEGVHCPRCEGRGEFIDCVDDLCHWKGKCFHTGNTVCSFCDGTGRVSTAKHDSYWTERYQARAQLSPIGTVVLVAVVGALFILSLAIVNGVIFG